MSIWKEKDEFFHEMTCRSRETGGHGSGRNYWNMYTDLLNRNWGQEALYD